MHKDFPPPTLAQRKIYKHNRNIEILGLVRDPVVRNVLSFRSSLLRRKFFANHFPYPAGEVDFLLHRFFNKRMRLTDE